MTKPNAGPPGGAHVFGNVTSAGGAFASAGDTNAFICTVGRLVA